MIRIARAQGCPPLLLALLPCDYDRLAWEMLLDSARWKETFRGPGTHRLCEWGKSLVSLAPFFFICKKRVAFEFPHGDFPKNGMLSFVGMHFVAAGQMTQGAEAASARSMLPLANLLGRNSFLLFAKTIPATLRKLAVLWTPCFWELPCDWPVSSCHVNV